LRSQYFGFFVPLPMIFSCERGNMYGGTLAACRGRGSLRSLVPEIDSSPRPQIGSNIKFSNRIRVQLPSDCDFFPKYFLGVQQAQMQCLEDLGRREARRVPFNAENADIGIITETNAPGNIVEVDYRTIAEISLLSTLHEEQRKAHLTMVCVDGSNSGMDIASQAFHDVFRDMPLALQLSSPSLTGAMFFIYLTEEGKNVARRLSWVTRPPFWSGYLIVMRAGPTQSC
jgi:hypothetical protein